MKKKYHLNDVTQPNAKGTYKNDLDDAGPISFFKLFRFATKLDLILILIGLIVTFIKSMAMPFLIVTYGEFTTLLVDRTKGTGTSSATLLLPLFGGGKVLKNATLEENRAEIVNDSVAYGILLSIATSLQLITGVICVDAFNHSALRQITRIRIRYFESLMRQEIGWYDVTGGSNNFAVRLTEDIEKIRNGIGEKVSHFLFLIFGFVICLIMSFIYGWKLALALVSYIPIVIIANLIITKIQASLSTKETNAYSEAANVAEEVFSGIRTVFAFCGEKNEIDRYNKKLIVAKSAGKRKGLLSGIGDGLMRFLFFASNAIGFWYGVQLVLADRDKEIKEYTPAVLMITFFGLITGADSITRAAPFLEAFATARGSASIIFKVIDRDSRIDSTSTEGKTINANVKGNITFKNVSFSYPSRADVQILRDLSLEIHCGQSIALVGHSGNGKSTCLQLLQRFYDPDDGQVLIDDIDIRSLNLNVLRSMIATVGQEPVLFSTTIAENIRFGNPNATDMDIIAAAQQSGGHDFISKFPKGYNTLVGEKGSQMSGGQKQRIAIARALIQNPKILLLDEATSALDYQSEKYVQETLDRASKGRTTIIVSHRLSAIRSADRILFIDKGQVIEDGTHNELIAMKGQYFKMITAHNFTDDNDALETQVPTVNELHETNLNCKVNDKQFFNDQADCENLFGSDSVDKMENNKSKKKKTAEEAIHYWKVLKRVLHMMKPDWFLMLIAAMSSIAIGACVPAFAVLFAEVYGALSLEDASEAFNQTLIMCISFFIVGVILFIAAILQTFFFTNAGINLSTRARSMAFTSMLKQECAWFDEEDNSVGALSTRLTEDASSLQGAIGFPVSIFIQSISTFVIGIIISIAFSLKLVMVCLSVLPLSLITVIYEARQTSKMALVEKTAMETGSKIATEAITNIRTIASLRQEKHTIGRFIDEMMKLEKIVKSKIAWRGLANSVAQSIPFFGYAISLYYGGLLIANGEIHFKDVLKTSESLMYGTVVLSQTLILVPSITAAFVGAHRIFKTIDRISQISSPNVSNKARKPDKGNDIEYEKIDFRYPTRPDVQIFNDFSLHIKEGKTIALVGASGCGKSTCIQLLQRLYDPEHGRVYIGLDEISNDISLNEVRSKLSIVSQEPVLFDKTIAQNIAYGDNSRDVSINEIMDAAKVANVHNFIVQLPQGYETSLGSKTAQLSGGQKQRIAIARAIIRNPKILLLDEATSALDLQGEQVVQQALDAAKTGRTCIIIAHRLSTVQNVDAICVIRNGNIVEYGTHTDLLSLGGIYTRLYNAQK